MNKITQQKQIQEFLTSLSKQEISLIKLCYQDPYFIDFDEVLVCVKKENPQGFKKDIPMLKRWADFERKYKVKLYELLDIPKLNYQGKKQFIYEGLTLPVGVDDKGRDIVISLDNQEQITLHMRDNEFRGSWVLFKQDVKDHKFIKCLGIDKLKSCEEKYKVNLGVLMRMYGELESEKPEIK